MAYFEKFAGTTDKGRSRVLSEFSIVKLLGSGGFGAVFQAQNELDKRDYALKISITQGGFDQLKEVQNLAKIPPHKNIVMYTTAWRDSFNQVEIDILPLDLEMKTELRSRGQHLGFEGIVIQMELCGHDLRKWLADHPLLNEVRVLGIFEQVVEAVEHLHLHDLIHRDLKPENIFLSYNDPYKIKVGDLGIATDHLKGTKSQTHTKGFGTRLYIAPEQESSGSYTKSVDLFSLGLILFELFWPQMQPTNVNGFSWDILAQHFRDLKYKEKLPTSLINTWPYISQLIQKLTDYEPKSRPGFKEIYTVIEEAKQIFKPCSTNSAKSSGYSSSDGIDRKNLTDKLNLMKIEPPNQKLTGKEKLVPTKFQQILNLRDFGIDIANETSNNIEITIDSGQIVCRKNYLKDKSQFIKIDICEPTPVLKSVDSEIPFGVKNSMLSSNYFGYYTRNIIYMYSLEKIVKSVHQFHNDIYIKFCKWIDANILEIITYSNYGGYYINFHWLVNEPNSKPMHTFSFYDKFRNLTNIQDYYYTTNTDLKLHSFITQTQDSGSGSKPMYGIQLYSTSNEKIEWSDFYENSGTIYGVTFAHLYLENIILFCYVIKNANGDIELRIKQVKSRVENKEKIVKIFFINKDDSPLYIQTSSKFEIIYLVTKHGFIKVYDLSTGTCIYMDRIPYQSIKLIGQNKSKSGIIGIQTDGQVFSVEIDEKTILPYLLEYISNEELAFRYAYNGGNLIGAKDIIMKKFNNLFLNSKYIEAAKLAALAPNEMLRTTQNIQKFKGIFVNSLTKSSRIVEKCSTLLIYCDCILERGSLNQEESFEYSRIILEQGNRELFEKNLQENKLKCSDKLEKFVRKIDPVLALAVNLKIKH